MPWPILGIVAIVTLRVESSDQSFESINVGLPGILLLPEALKGEAVTVGVALFSISSSVTFTGVNNGSIG